MSTPQMTPSDALRILDIATNPVNVGKLERVDYANIETALSVLRKLIDSVPVSLEEKSN